MPDMAVIRADFDRIAHLEEEAWTTNKAYYSFLLKQLPAHCSHALDIGCGTGEFARLLAQRTDHVVALDLSPEMIRLAKERSMQCSNIDFQLADVLTWDFPRDQFDCVASIATLHHMPLEPVLMKIKQAIKPNGTLIILDLTKDETLMDYLTSSIAFPASILMRLVHNKRWKSSPETRAAWEEHGKSDIYLPLSEVWRVCQSVLPGAQVQRHLFWRYSLVWTKPR